MQYLYHKGAGDSSIKLRGEEYRYILKVRRHQRGDIIHLRNLKDITIYSYKIESINRREALLTLQSSRELEVKSERELHLGWCIIEPKTIERTLPMLNEMGVTSITFIYCQRSQRSFKLDFKRLERILINSSQQCGRSSIIKLELLESLESLIAKYPDSTLLNFSDNILDKGVEIKNIVVGCEGGFTDEETNLFKSVVGLNTPLILRSESAICAVASKLLL
jgi:16S rRNA (uracil1498-N3)-methyltransferase